MSIKTVVTLALLLFVAVAVGTVILQSRDPVADSNPSAAGATNAPNSDLVDGVVAFDFHGTMRCVTCKKLEAYSRDAFEGSDVELEVINVDLPENHHFIDDFQLVTRSLVLAEYRSGQIVRSANLERIWELVGDPVAFLDYVHQQAVEFDREV
jgi:hypothetical protein